MLGFVVVDGIVHDKVDDVAQHTRHDVLVSGRRLEADESPVAHLAVLFVDEAHTAA